MDVLRREADGLLTVLAAQGYTVVESIEGPDFGNARVLLASSRLRIRITRDRGTVFIEFQAPTRKPSKEWFDVEVVRWWLTKTPPSREDSNDLLLQFVRAHFVEIEQAFQPGHVSETATALRHLEAKRSRALFG